MRNKLKNILKTGILHKVLTLRQVILFFRGLGYNIYIVDPSCFVLRNKDPPLEQVTDTQEIVGSQDGLVEVERYPPPLVWSDELAKLAGSFEEDRRGTDSAMGSKRPNHGKGGGTKRKRSMRSYSRKRRTRRKRYTRRR